MKLKREAALLKQAAIDSMIVAVDHFNRTIGPARLEASVIFAQRAFEMLLKAAILQETGRIRDKGEKYTYSFDKCLNIAVDGINVLDDEGRVALRALDTDRDAATHHLLAIDEPLLYIKMQSAVTIFSDLLNRAFDEQLTDHLPARVLPVSADPPDSLEGALASELTIVRELIAPGRRRLAEAKARLRAILNLDAAATGRTDPPTDQELNRAIRALRSGRDWKRVFPGVATLEIHTQPGPGTIPIALRLTRGQGPAVRLAQPEEEAEALLYREVNPFDRWPLSPVQLADRVGIGRMRTWALVEHLDLKDDEGYYKDIPVGAGQTMARYSPHAVDRLREDAENQELLNEAWAAYRARHGF